jgi:putative transposase
MNISKQAVHKIIQRDNEKKENILFIKQIVSEVRKEHPSMGVRDIYHIMLPDFLGRDKFIELCRLAGLMIKRKKRFIHTTDSTGVIRFDNLTENLKITRINQVWQSDITFYKLNGVFYYITFIIDAFSRVIVGYSVSKRLTAEQTVIASLKKALKFRKGEDLSGLIFHSDGGKQYIAQEFLDLSEGFKHSMCVAPWENGIAERINGVIKNNYLSYRTITNYETLVKEVDRSVYLYNYKKPHCKLQRMTPISFEKSIYLQNQNSEEKKSSKILNPSSELGLGLAQDQALSSPNKDKSTIDNMPKTSKQTVNHF